MVSRVISVIFLYLFVLSFKTVFCTRRAVSEPTLTACLDDNGQRYGLPASGLLVVLATAVFSALAAATVLKTQRQT